MFVIVVINESARIVPRSKETLGSRPGLTYMTTDLSKTVFIYSIVSFLVLKKQV
jgi:hypothetical protein